MIYEVVTTLEPAEVVTRAVRFFAERVPNLAAYPEKTGPGWVVLRGQGGEEIALAATASAGGTHVRGSTLLFDQPLDRFLQTLPAAAGQPA